MVLTERKNSITTQHLLTEAFNEATYAIQVVTAVSFVALHCLGRDSSKRRATPPPLVRKSIDIK